MRTRAYRREKMERAKSRSRFYATNILSFPPYNSSFPTERWIGIRAHTRHPCSGLCCGNERLHGGPLPPQWQRENDRLEASLVEAGLSL